MRRLLCFFVLLAVVLASVSTGCQFLPPLPTVSQSPSTQVPPDLTGAANRILPSTVIVDTPFATGSGWILDSGGIIVTNYHVVEGARIVVVTLHDGRRFNVSSKAADPIGDLAILRINATDLPSAVIGKSSDLKIGDPVVAVGNSLGEGISIKTGRVTGLNVTVGIENEEYYGLIEDNAPIQEGDSGGPLVNKAGEVIGVSNAKVIGLEEISYAINIDSAMPILQQLISNGSVDRAYLGISGLDNPTGNGVLVQEVVPGGPADEAGLKPGDIILSLNDDATDDMATLRQRVRSKSVGQQVTITYRRGSSQSTTIAILIQYPAV
jgi:serine protease Do